MYSARINFGKHSGQLVCDVPTGYLRWMLAKVGDLHPRIRQEAEAVLRDRGVNPQASSSVVNLREVFRTWFAGLALDFHPDRIGGDGREMKVVNEAAERLKKLVGIA